MRRLFGAFLLVAGVMLPARGEIPAGERRSGFEMMGADLQSMQRDDISNPAMLSAHEGERLFSAPPREGARSCSGCHEIGRMKGVAAHYPATDAASGRLYDLPERIRQCQNAHQRVEPAARESASLLALQAFLALQSRGTPIRPADDANLYAATERGKRLFETRFGQLNLSCRQCHDENWGKSLGGTRIPQGHPTGYPIFRAEWQAVGSLQRRIRNCMTGVRAEPFAPGSPEMIDLEAYLMRRASGMAMDAPAVRP